ncbi:MAG: hypothetical protein LBK71_04365 [Verrucomicrobiales bacterium]|jgi:hypothetical protein|nr:hypothetical protein [Verrucomicrobiales bacterium]
MSIDFIEPRAALDGADLDPAIHPPLTMHDLLRALATADHGVEYSPVSTVQDGRRVQLERYVFIGPESTHQPFRLAVFGALRGDDRFSPYAIAEFIRDLINQPGLATGFHLYFYPVAHPSQYADPAATVSAGRDLFVDLWQDSPRPEPYLIERELAVVQFHGVIALFALKGLGGLSVQLHGSWSSLRESLVLPVLADAAEFHPIARPGDWVASRRLSLTAGGGLQPKPFELSVKIPQATPAREQILAQRVTLHSILRHYRAVVAESQHL